MNSQEYNEQFTLEELANEIWKDISSYEGFYQVSNLGRVKSLSRLRKYGKNYFKCAPEVILKPIIKNDDKRCVVVLYKDKAKKLYRRGYVYRIVLETFIGPCPEGMEACHNDGNRYNNRLSNLRWDTHANNEVDKVKHGTSLRGEKQWKHKLTSGQVLEIRKLYKMKIYNQKQLGKIYGVCRVTITDIISRRNWGWLYE